MIRGEDDDSDENFCRFVAPNITIQRPAPPGSILTLVCTIQRPAPPASRDKLERAIRMIDDINSNDPSKVLNA